MTTIKSGSNKKRHKIQRLTALQWQSGQYILRTPDLVKRREWSLHRMQYIDSNNKNFSSKI